MNKIINPHTVVTKDQYLRTDILIIQINLLKLPELHFIKKIKIIILNAESSSVTGANFFIYKNI